MSDRKYRQRGYQDADGDEARSRSPRTPRPEGFSGPRGRGLGRPSNTVFRCAVCGARQPMGGADFDAACGQCGADLHTCTHCQHFDPSASKECRQSIAERVPSKAKRNACEHFAPKATQEFARESGRPEDARDAFDSLFKI